MALSAGKPDDGSGNGTSTKKPRRPPSLPRPRPVVATMPTHTAHLHRILRMNKAAAEAAGGPAAPSRQERIQTLCRAYSRIALNEGKGGVPGWVAHCFDPIARHTEQQPGRQLAG
jgi:hypothetical protein